MVHRVEEQLRARGLEHAAAHIRETYGARPGHGGRSPAMNVDGARPDAGPQEAGWVVVRDPAGEFTDQSRNAVVPDELNNKRPRLSAGANVAFTASGGSPQERFFNSGTADIASGAPTFEVFVHARLMDPVEDWSAQFAIDSQVTALRQRVASAADVSPSDVVLICNRKILRDDCSLRDFLTFEEDDRVIAMLRSDEVDGEERRLAEDRVLYTKQQFLDHYGGLLQWDVALRVQIEYDPLGLGR